jgi:anti-sigma factor RsiW
MNCNDTQDLLNGYADGELDLVNHLRVDEHLENCSSCRQINANQQTLKSAMADSSLYYRASPDLRTRVQTALREAGNESPTGKIWQWHWPALATVFGVITIAVLGLVYFQTSQNNDELLAKEIVSAHIRSMMANHLTDVPSSDQHTVKPWFDGKLDFSPPVIDTTEQGFPLMGGRLDYAGNRPVAALIYQRRKHFINLFVFPASDSSEGGSKITVRQGYNVIHWNRSGMTFWAVSDINLSELQEFTQAVQN